MNIINQNFMEQTAARHLQTKSLRHIASAIIQQAVLDYRALVRRGIIVAGVIRWPHKAGFKVDNMCDSGEAQTAQDFFTPNGHMEELIHAAALDISPEMVRRSIGWTASPGGAGGRYHNLPSRELIRRCTVGVIAPLRESQIDSAMGNYVRRSQAKNKIKPPHEIDRTSPLAKLCQRVADWYGVTLDDIHAGGRKQPAALARQVCMYVFRNQGKLDTESGAYFGRDRTCVYESVEKIGALLKQDSNESRQLRPLLAQLNGTEQPAWIDSTKPIVTLLPAAA